MTSGPVVPEYMGSSKLCPSIVNVAVLVLSVILASSSEVLSADRPRVSVSYLAIKAVNAFMPLHPEYGRESRPDQEPASCRRRWALLLVLQELLGAVLQVVQTLCLSLRQSR